MAWFLRKAAVGLLAACGVVGVAAVPGAAADYPTNTFWVYHSDPETLEYGYTNGSITWYNRTANIKGTVVDNVSPQYVKAYFEAFAGSEKIDSTTRTASSTGDPGSPRDFNFTIGDTDLAGGIDRIKITVCLENSSSDRDCSAPVNYAKP